jgi:hypothetical protein
LSSKFCSSFSFLVIVMTSSRPVVNIIVVSLRYCNNIASLFGYCSYIMLPIILQ